MPAIRGLLFDKDGTLFDFRSTWGGWTRRVIGELAHGSERRGAELAALLGYDLGSGDFARDSVVIGHTVGEIAEILAPELPGHTAGALVDLLNGLAIDNDMVPAVPLVPLFTRLAGMGLQLGLATNDAEQPARVHLDRAGLSPFFDFVAGFDSGYGGKPETGQMQAFLARTGLPAPAVAMVGDSLHDLDAGRAAGMRTVAVLTGIADRAALAPHADVVLGHIGELPDWIAAAG